MSILNFNPIRLSDFETIGRYMSKYGESSCQHAFVSMYALSEKYGDLFCEREGFLYILRSGLCDENFRVYLAPMGEGNLKAAYSAIVEDAHSYGCKVRFHTLTRKHAEYLQNNFPEAFISNNERGLAEYFYRAENLASFAGLELKQKRKELHRFLNTYGDSLSFTPVAQSDIPDILGYEEEWVNANRESHDESALLLEQSCITKVLKYRRELGISGSVMRIDGVVRGFFLGFGLNDTCFDGMFEKCDKSLRFSYRAMMNEVGRHCAGKYKYLNMEEDLGIEGLRAMKMSYKPAFILEKFSAVEI